MAEVLELTLPPAPSSAAAARQRVRELSVPEPVGDALALLVTELVSNAIRHAGLEECDPITLHAGVDDGWVHVEVIDNGRGFHPGRSPTDLTTPGGLGLVLVERLADRWGVQSGDETCVWFDLEQETVGRRFARS